MNYQISDLPPKFGDCTCDCHRFPGVSHIMACCGPWKETITGEELKSRILDFKTITQSNWKAHASFLSGTRQQAIRCKKCKGTCILYTWMRYPYQPREWFKWPGTRFPNKRSYNQYLEGRNR